MSRRKESTTGDGISKSYCYSCSQDAYCQRFNCVRFYVQFVPKTNDPRFVGQTVLPAYEQLVAEQMQGIARDSYSVTPAKLGRTQSLDRRQTFFTCEILVYPRDYGSCLLCFLRNVMRSLNKDDPDYLKSEAYYSWDWGREDSRNIGYATA